MTAKEIIIKLQDRGVSKYFIAKSLNVHWNTIHMWSKKVFKPSKDNYQKLIKLLEGERNIKKRLDLL